MIFKNINIKTTLILVNFFLSFCLQAQVGGIRSRSKIIVPNDYDSNKLYPVLVAMPYTNGTAQDFINKYYKEAGIDININTQKEHWSNFLDFYQEQYNTTTDFILIVPDGRGGRRDHSWSGFAACIERYEDRVIKDVTYYAKQYSLDTNRVYISGVSLGGDLSWALSVRNPIFFQGAIVMGSRCSFPPYENMPILADKQFRFFLAMGMEESYDRLAGMRYARQLLDADKVEYDYREMPDLSHNRAPVWLYLEGLRFISQEQSSIGSTLMDQDKPYISARNYTASIEINYYNMNNESNSLVAKGDGLLIPDSTKWIDLNVYMETDSSQQLLIKIGDLPTLKTTWTVEKDNYFGSMNYFIEIPEQNINSYRYQGIAYDKDSPRKHGEYQKDSNGAILLFDLEKIRLPKQQYHQVYSIFIELE